MAAQGSGEQIVELVTQMQNTIEHSFMPSLQDLENKLDTEIGRVRDWLQDITGAVHEVKPLIHDGLASAVQVLGQTEQTVKQEVDQCVQAVNTLVGHVHDGKSHTTELLTTATGHATDMMDKLQHADDTHGQAHDQITHTLGDWTSAVQEHLGTLDTHHGQVVDAWHSFTDHTNTHFTDLTTKLTSAGELVTEKSTATLQTHSTNVTEFLTHQKDHLVSGVGEAIGGHVGDVMGHVEGFMQTGESLGQLFDGGLGDVLSKVDEVSGLLDSIKPVIEMAKAIE